MPTLRSYMPSRASLRRPISPLDLGVLVAVLVLLYVVLKVGSGTTARFDLHGLEHVSTSPSRLPYDAVRSLLRMFIGLVLSMAFTLVYGYAAARSRRAERVLVPILDVLQSVPVLGFLTITVTLFIGIFPHSELGLECAAIFAIFTSQAWNITFSFYASLKALPRELDELSRSLRLTKWQRYWKMEVPSAAIGLVWNGMMSFGGAWFFLVASEAITIPGTGSQAHYLPGVGSYAGAAIKNGNLGDVGLAIATMVIMIIGVNVLFWRPLVAYAERYRFETTEATEVQRSLFLNVLNRSSWPRTLGALRVRLAEPLGRAMTVLGYDDPPPIVAAGRERTGDIVFGVLIGAAILFGAYEALHYIAAAKHAGLSQFPHCALLGLATFGRVVVLLAFATVVWVPVGVWIGLDPRVSRLAQPVVQVLASFPANFIFPLATYLFIKLGISINIGGIALMALGAQWYILFNVIAGASAIPSDLREAMDMLGVRGWQRWRQLIIPGILTSYVTGGITAAGGAWNASIVAEYVTYHKSTLIAYGLGSYIVQASNAGNTARLICGIVVMSIYVVGVNRLVWRRLYRLAESRYSL
jgi:NitT/TauT family transport system permease protein